MPLEQQERYRRHCLKMATGSGKTVVMAMLIAWSVLNKARQPTDRRFSDAVLVLCPNLTVKERLAVLRPAAESNYYEHFDLGPPGLQWCAPGWAGDGRELACPIGAGRLPTPRRAIDFSATPSYLSGSGHAEGEPFG